MALTANVLTFGGSTPASIDGASARGSGDECALQFGRAAIFRKQLRAEAVLFAGVQEARQPADECYVAGERVVISKFAIADPLKAAEFAESLRSMDLPDWSCPVDQHHHVLVEAFQQAAAAAFPKASTEPRAQWIGSATWDLRASRCAALKSIKEVRGHCTRAILLGFFSAWRMAGVRVPIYWPLSALASIDDYVLRLMRRLAFAELFIKMSFPQYRKCLKCDRMAHFDCPSQRGL